MRDRPDPQAAGPHDLTQVTRRSLLRDADFGTSLPPTGGFVTGVEISGNHNANRLDPTGNFANSIEAAFCNRLVFGCGASVTALRCAAGLLDTEEFQPLVVFVETSGNRGEVITSSPSVRSISRT